MATLSGTAHSFVTDDTPSPSFTDPFWLSNPRGNPQALAALMAAVQNVSHSAFNPVTHMLQRTPTPAPASTTGAISSIFTLSAARVPDNMLQVRPQLTRSQVHTPPAGLQRNGKPPLAPQVRRPQCTHVSMHRLYGPHACHTCGKIPSLGWVYACGQDALQHSQQANYDADSFLVVPDSVDYFEAQARVAESLGMNKSIATQMRAGEYNLDQIETLLEQKRHLIEIIKESEAQLAVSSSSSSRPSPVKPRPAPESVIATVGVPQTPQDQQKTDTPRSLPMSGAGTPLNTPVESANSSPAKNRAKSRKRQACGFHVCHTCRPFFQDRLPMSFESVLSGEMPAITEEEMSGLPMLDASVVRNLGLRYLTKTWLPLLRSQESMDITQQTDGFADNDTSDWTPTSHSSNDNFSSVLDDNDTYPCPGPGICPLYSQTYGCAYENGFDDGKRAANHGFISMQNRFQHNSLSGDISPISPSGTPSPGSSVSLPSRSTNSLTPITPTDTSLHSLLSTSPGKAATVCGVASADHQYRFGHARKDSKDSFGSAVDIGGGVALTEEAVGAGTADIIAAA